MISQKQRRQCASRYLPPASGCGFHFTLFTLTPLPWLTTPQKTSKGTPNTPLRRCSAGGGAGGGVGGGRKDWHPGGCRTISTDSLSALVV